MHWLSSIEDTETLTLHWRSSHIDAGMGTATPHQKKKKAVSANCALLRSVVRTALVSRKV